MSSLRVIRPSLFARPPGSLTSDLNHLAIIMAGPYRTKSDDFANALEEAVSAMHEDDLQLMGGAHELTIDQIHSLSSEGSPLPASL